MSGTNAPNSLGNTCEYCGLYFAKVCQLNPRTPLVLPSGDIIFYYPEVQKDDWCSHWQPAEEPDFDEDTRHADNPVEVPREAHDPIKVE